MQNVKIPQCTGESIFRDLISLYSIFKNVKEDCVFDFSKTKWLSPTIVLPIAAYIHDFACKFSPPQDPKIHNYFDIIAFPNGVKLATQIKEDRSYVPISYLTEKPLKERENLENKFLDTVYHVLNPTVDVKNAIYYPLGELIENIFQHSGRKDGFLFAQYYQTKEFMDACIVDLGIGLSNNYKKAKGWEFTDDQAIEKAISGLSTKKEKGRGFGISTSKRVISEALNGEFLIISGSAALYSTHNKNSIYTLPDFYWKGVIVSYRIPKPRRAVDIYPYLEG